MFQLQDETATEYLGILGTEGIMWSFGRMLLECTVSGFDS